jgi:hypothetical protein
VQRILNHDVVVKEVIRYAKGSIGFFFSTYSPSRGFIEGVEALVFVFFAHIRIFHRLGHGKRERKNFYFIICSIFALFPMANPKPLEETRMRWVEALGGSLQLR